MLVDGYVDEPTCLGVPPYMSTYPRYITGAIWRHSPRTEVLYRTIDQTRVSFDAALETWRTADMVVLIAGMIVPGKYLGGSPISVREARELFSDTRLDGIPKLLVGPWARFGCGLEGGRAGIRPENLSPPFDYIVKGDSEVVIGEMYKTGAALSSLDLTLTRSSAQEIEEYVLRGAPIVQQAPGFKRGHLICEIETYRGCPRFMTGGCSFCTEPLYGEPQQRDVSSIVREVEALYGVGVRAFRLGRQADLFSYGSREMGEVEFPRPAPQVIQELFSRIRTVAPNLTVLHIDNVNPGTVVRYPEESRAVALSIMKYHTTGDVAAFGVESADPEVIRRNNLKVSPDQALEAVRIINEVGAQRPQNELPHLLPGLNFVYGLPGETKKTTEHNIAFLEQILKEGLMLRRINIRQVITFPSTRLAENKEGRIKRGDFIAQKQDIRNRIDVPMLKRVAPPGTIIRSTFIEEREGNNYLLRPLGSYPLLCQMPPGHMDADVLDVFVVDHGPRSVTVLPYPMNVHTASIARWKAVPGIGSKRAARLKSSVMLGPHDLVSVLEMQMPDWLTRCLNFEPGTDRGYATAAQNSDNLGHPASGA